MHNRAIYISRLYQELNDEHLKVDMIEGGYQRRWVSTKVDVIED
jgi:hypothetical protein